MNATLTAAAGLRYFVARSGGRYCVFSTRSVEEVEATSSAASFVATCASRAKAEERAAKLNAAVAEARADGASPAEAADAAEYDAARDDAAAAGECPALCGEPAGHGPSAEGDCPLAIHPVPTAPLEVVTLDGTETTVTVEETPELTPAELAAKVAAEAEEEGRYADAREARSAELAELVNAGEMTFDEAAALLIAERGEVPAKPAAEPMRSLWVAAAFVPIILADAAPERATLVAKLDASVPNNRGGRTVRLTRAEAEELAAIGTEIENSVNGAGRMAHSARTMRDRLAALWA